MKRISIFAIAISAAAFALPPMETSAQSTDVKTIPSDTNSGDLDPKTSGTNVRVSKLMGQNIQNAKGESVGEIQDLVIDSSSGRVCYAAVTYGGFLGMGDKLFAVPFEAFTVTHNPDDPNNVDSYIMVLNVTKDQLEGSKGFDQDHWPNMADSTMIRDLDKRYGIDRAKLRERRRHFDLNVDVDRSGVDVKVKRE
jgi:sporulation protein YlmC with PRC-barrel domain